MSNLSVMSTPSTITSTLFIEIGTVARYPDALKFEENEPKLYHEMISRFGDISGMVSYHNLCHKYPELSKIAAVSIGIVTINDDGSLKRSISKKYFDDEIDAYKYITSIANTSCDNMGVTYISSFNKGLIPYLAKTYYILKNKYPNIVVPDLNISIPNIVKRAVSAKIWESPFINPFNIWEFGGFIETSISSPINIKYLSEVLGLKSSVELRDPSEHSKDYHYPEESNNKAVTTKETAINSMLDDVINRVNLNIQFFNKFR